MIVPAPTVKYRTRSGLPVRLLCSDFINNREVVIGLMRVGVPEDRGMLAAEEPFAWYRDTGQWTGDNDPTFDLVEIKPYENWPQDSPVWVSTQGLSSWHRRHFAGVDENGKPQAWIDGLTSWTTDRKSTWDDIRLASEFTPD